MLNDKKYIYIAFFLFSVLLFYWVGGRKAAFWYLILVFAGVLFANVGQYDISIKTPEILR